MKKIAIGIIGCGNMGQAIVRGLSSSSEKFQGGIFAYDKDTEKAASLSKETGCSIGELSQMVRGSDILVIAVKPQDFDELSGSIASDIVDQTIVSIMAGVTIGAIISKIGKEVGIARAMPNMAAFTGESMTCIAYNNLVKERDTVKEIFSGIGKVLEIDESNMDAVTALSGSGPAYLFYLANNMIKAGEELGLDSALARELVLQTLYGGSILLKESKDMPQELVNKVASKGGTTEAALSVFDEKGMDLIVKEAIEKASRRSQELSGR